jgi:hypothetical protein
MTSKDLVCTRTVMSCEVYNTILEFSKQGYILTSTVQENGGATYWLSFARIEQPRTVDELP